MTSTRLLPIALAATLLSAPLFAADPATGTLSDAQPTASWTGGPYVIPNPVAQVADPVCEEGTPACDVYRITLNFPEVDPDNDQVTIRVEWAEAQADFDFYVYEEDCTTAVSAGGAGSANPETAVLTPDSPTAWVNKTYCVQIIPFLPIAQTYNGTVAYESFAPGRAKADPAVPDAILGGPEFHVFNPAKPLDTLGAAEPTMGINLNTNNAFMIYGKQAIRTKFDDSTSPATTAWDDVTNGSETGTDQFDPFMADDQYLMPDGKPNPRIWSVHFQLATSVITFTDDEGETWTKTAMNGLPAGVDNESIAAGPYPEGSPLSGLPAPLGYPHAFYYCAHGGVNAFCARSDDGGMTYKPGVAIFPEVGLQCSNHGHVKVGPDGTVYVPMNYNCTGGQGVSVSIDAGLTWTYIRAPGDDAAGSGRWDSSIGIASDGKTLYYGYGSSASDEPFIVKGTLEKVADPTTPSGFKPQITWGTPVNVGVPGNVHNIAFSTVVAGDPDRAAYAFHGSSKRGNSGDKGFTGTWYLYVATTYDGGQTWELRNVNPSDPTQKGGVCDQGINCGSSPPYRNLLDFMDMVLDRDGRIVVGHADGCVKNCTTPTGRPTYSQLGAFARQAGGKPLYAINDSKFVGVNEEGLPPVAPVVSARALHNTVHLSWQPPYDGGKPILGYRVFRTAAGTSPLALPVVSTQKTYFVDRSVLPGVNYTYTVQAFNALGNGGLSPVTAPVSVAVAPDRTSGTTDDDDKPTVENDAKAEGDESACVPPGETVVEDATGDPLSTEAVPQTLLASEDVELIAVSEPGNLPGKIVFTLKVTELADPLPPQHRWVVYFTAPDNTEWYAAMTNAEPPGTLAFEYGKTVYTTAGGQTVGQFAPEGALEAESAYTADGYIALVVDKAKIGGLDVGAPIDLIYAKTRDSSANPGTQNAGVTRDDTGSGFYEVIGNDACESKALPVAQYTVSSRTGAVPVTISFDAATAFVDEDLSIVEYRWDFGDGETLVTDDAQVSHTYTKVNAYRPSLQVVDSRGQVSNYAWEVLLFGEDTPSDGVFDEGYSIFGGALPLGTLLALAGLGALAPRLRRRKEIR